MTPSALPKPSLESPHRRHVVRTEEDVGALRRAVAALTTTCEGVQPGEAALVATELGTNLVRHADGGYVLYRRLARGIELLAVDRGPGMPHGGRLALRGHRPTVTQAATSGAVGQDGRVAGDGLGVGLGTVERLATTFDLYSSQPDGTVVLARLTDGPAAPSWCRWGAVDVPLHGEGESGDRWAVAADGGLLALVVDGLGHGPEAARASLAAVAAFRERPVADVERLVRQAHEAMVGTRGGALGVCAVDPGRGELVFAGVGNVLGRLVLDGRSRSVLGQPGTLGGHGRLPRSRPVRHPWKRGAVLALATDGLRSRWDPLASPALLGHDPTVVAAVLERDHGRPNDDVTVLVVKDVRSSVASDPGPWDRTARA